MTVEISTLKPQVSTITPLSDLKPCERCGDKPTVSRDKLGFNVFHVCGVSFRGVLNYETQQAAETEWNNR